MSIKLPEWNPKETNWNNSNQYIYHYTTAETFLTKICFGYTHRLMMSNFFSESSNDPLEKEEWNVSSGGGSNPNNFKAVDMIAAARFWKERSYRLSFCMDLPERRDSDHYKDELLGLGCADSKMWAQYANKHTGVCIVLDKDLFIESIKDQIKDALLLDHSKVEYKTKVRTSSTDYDKAAQNGGKEYFLDKLRIEPKPFFFQKHIDWQHEQEFRTIAVFRDPNDVFVNIERCVRGLMLGTYFPNHWYLDKPKLAKTFRQIYQMSWDYGKRSCYQAASIDWPDESGKAEI
jgi:hypothetical protein